jgi:hypothetical protein
MRSPQKGIESPFMVDVPVDRPWELIVPGHLWDDLNAHLFPGDDDEHGAVMLAGIHVRGDRVRLLARELVVAKDGVDHVPSNRGYKMIKAEFIHPLIRRARDQNLVFLSIHNHGGHDVVEFSDLDLASHERGYPALIDIARGMPVGGLVFATNAIAGDIWLKSGRRVSLKQAIVLGDERKVLKPRRQTPSSVWNSALYDRQIRLFGEEGQRLIQKMRVGIVGLGGAGSILAELLARLGVSDFVLMDPDRVERSNLPRLVASRFTDAIWPRKKKVDLAARNIWRANRRAQIRKVAGSIGTQENAGKLLDCDFIFLAADQMTARLAFNSIVHQYLIPGVQVGARVVTDPALGEILDVYAVSRPVNPSTGCLWCNGLIDPTKLQSEATERKQAAAQAYGTESRAPSVISLNALAAADAVNYFQFWVTGLAKKGTSELFRRHKPLRGALIQEIPRADDDCLECSQSDSSRLSRGDVAVLPLAY